MLRVQYINTARIHYYVQAPFGVVLTLTHSCTSSFPSLFPPCFRSARRRNPQKESRLRVRSAILFACARGKSDWQREKLPTNSSEGTFDCYIL